MPQKKKIALFSTSFLAYSQTFIYDEIMAHSDHYDITVFCKNRLNESRFPYENFHSPPNGLPKFIYENFTSWPPFDRVFKKEKFDLIHAHFGTGAVYALPFAKKFNIPLVVTFHGNDVAALFGPRTYFPKQWRYNIVIKKIISQMSLGLAVSNELIELLKNLGCEDEKLKHVRLGIDTSKFKAANVEKGETIRFLLIGRFTEKKGHIYALRAFKQLIDTGHKAHLSFIGDGDLLNECVTYSNQNSLDEYVTFKGVMDSNEVANELNKSHVLLSPSVVSSDFDREGLPTVIKEAMACEVPVIGTYHAGIPELIIDTENGFLVQERDIHSLAKKMIAFIEQPELISRFGQKGREKVLANFDIKKEVLALEEFYETAIEEYS